MSRKFVEVEHAGVEGTARVPESALKLMRGWKPVKKAAAAPAKKTAAKKTAAKKVAAKKTAAPKTSPAPSAESKES